jgi:hypothetical protein
MCPYRVVSAIRASLATLRLGIVGHEKPRITYGLYSGGSGLAQKARAVELVRYPVAR